MIKRFINKIRRELNLAKAKKLAKKLGITFQKPTYIYKGPFKENSVIVDVGCCNDPDLSIIFMKSYNVFAYGVDPTKKHFEDLKNISKLYPKFRHLPFAVAEKDQILTFYESKDNDSGSLIASHKNVQKDQIESYEVTAIGINSLLKKIDQKYIDFLKLDLEGAEFALLEKIEKDDFNSVGQLYIEFHHHAIPEKSYEDTLKLVKKIENFGFSSFTIENANFLFYREDK